MQIKHVNKNEEVNSQDTKYILINCHNDGNSCVSDLFSIETLNHMFIIKYEEPLITAFVYVHCCLLLETEYRSKVDIEP